MKHFTILSVLLCLLLLSSCALSMYAKAKNVDEYIEALEAEETQGCLYLRGSANPPAAELDFDIAYAVRVPFTDCITIFRQ